MLTFIAWILVFGAGPIGTRAEDRPPETTHKPIRLETKNSAWPAPDDKERRADRLRLALELYDQFACKSDLEFAPRFHGLALATYATMRTFRHAKAFRLLSGQIQDEFNPFTFVVREPARAESFAERGGVRLYLFRFVRASQHHPQSDIKEKLEFILNAQAFTLLKGVKDRMGNPRLKRPATLVRLAAPMIRGRDTVLGTTLWLDPSQVSRANFGQLIEETLELESQLVHYPVVRMTTRH